mmetsp:Transcript_48628/g.103706  ORF Transcript_48628/g.103706 Transcript_48628/m.103706 type:complete len:521 (-) Transcript_48628:1040-2602(-)
MEARAREEIFDVRLDQPVAEQRLRRHDDKRLPKLAHHLPAQHVEVVGGRGDVDDGPVGRLRLLLPADALWELVLVIVAHLQEALEAGRRVLGPLPFEAVRKQHHEPRLAQPLLLARGDELVDHALGRVGEVTELRLPHDERCGVLEGVAELEAEHGEFGERRVDGNEGGLRGVDIGQRRVLPGPVDLVVYDRVPVREGASLDVLPRDADMVALEQQRGPRQLLAEGPVDALARVDHLAAVHVELTHLLMRLEVRGEGGECGAELEKSLPLDAGEQVLCLDIHRQHALPVGGKPVGLLGNVRARGVELGLQAGHHLSGELFCGLRRDDALLLQLFGVDLERRLLLLDRCVHLWLREHRVVDLVVPVLAVAHDIDHDVALEAVPPLCSESADASDGVDVVAVDVEDGCLDGLCHVSAVGRGAGRARVGGEADLIVDDEVDRAARRVAVQVGETHRLEDHPLPRKGRVAVDEYRHRLVALVVTRVVLLGAGLALDHGVGSLEVGGVGDERDVDLFAGGRSARV